MPKYRIKEHDPKSLRRIASDLRRFADSLVVFADTWEGDGFDRVEVRNNCHLERGLIGIGKFLDAIREAHHALRVDRGMYFAERGRR